MKWNLLRNGVIYEVSRKELAIETLALLAIIFFIIYLASKSKDDNNKK